MSVPECPGRLLILGLNYAPEEIGIGRYTAGLAEGLARRGWDVSVIAGWPYYPQWKVYAGFDGGWTGSRENGVRIVRCPHYVPRRPTGTRRILHLASFALAVLPIALHAALGRKAQRPDVVLCVVPALLSVPAAWIAARIAGARLWLHIQDFEVEAAFAAGLLTAPGKRGLLKRLAQAMESCLLRLSDRVSTISPQMCAKLIAKEVSQEQVVELRNWADSSVSPDPSRGRAYRDEWALGERRIALYSGNLANKQGIEILVEAAEALRNRSDILILICGEGANRSMLESRAAECANVMIKDLQPSSRMPELLGLAEVHLLPQLAGAADLVLPSKLVNMLASGRPIVATALPGTGLYDEVNGCGICTPPGDPGALAEAIAGLIDDPARTAVLGAQARQRAIDRWSQAAILDQFEAVAEFLAGTISRPNQHRG